MALIHPYERPLHMHRNTIELVKQCLVTILNSIAAVAIAEFQVGPCCLVLGI